MLSGARCGRSGRVGMECAEVYGGLVTALDNLTKEASVLADHHQKIRQYNMTLKKLNTSFDQVQSRLVRVAAVKPGLSKTLM